MHLDFLTISVNYLLQMEHFFTSSLHNLEIRARNIAIVNDATTLHFLKNIDKSNQNFFFDLTLVVDNFTSTQQLS